MEDFLQFLANNRGVVTLGQARGFGLTDNQIRYQLRTGQLIRVGPRVFRHRASPETWHSSARAAALAARGLVSHTSALVVWQVDGWTEHSWPQLHVTVEGQRRPRTVAGRLHRCGPGEDLAGHLVDGVPVTGVVRSVIDSAAVVGPKTLDAVIDAVIRQQLTSLESLVRGLEDLGTRGRKGAGVLGRLLDERSPSQRPPDSRFNRLVGQLLVDAGFGEPAYEWVVNDGGRFVGRADLAYPEQGLLIECDGARWHQDRQSFVDDPRRKNRLLLAGYRVLSFTWDDYAARPKGLVATVGRALTVSS